MEEKQEAEAQMANKPIEVDVVKKRKKPRPHKNSSLVKQNNFVYRICYHRLIVKLLYWRTWRMRLFVSGAKRS